MEHSLSPIENYFHHATRYHYYLFFLLFTTKMPMFWHILSLLFISPPMDYTCGKANITNACPCEKPIWNRHVFTETFQTKFGILCDREWLLSFSQSMLYVGTLVGGCTFGFLADRLGRLIGLSMSCLVMAIAGCLVIIMPNASTFILMRCVEGIGVGGAIVTGFVLLVEYCGPNYRETVTALYHIPINLGHITLPGISYLLRDFHDFQVALSVPVFLCVALQWLIYESPTWLVDNDNVTKATAIMVKISKFNRDPPERIKAEMDKYYATYVTVKHQKMSFWEIFKHRKLTLNLLCMSVIYFVCGMGYYGVSQFIGKMSGDIHLNVAISGAMLIPGTITAAFLLKILCRRSFLMSTSFLSGIGMIIVVCIPSHMTWARVAVACICNCFFFMSFIIVFLYGVELFPTSIRNSVLGMLSVLSRAGQIIAPPVNALPEAISGSIFGVMAILGGILCYPLPETKNVELPISLEESETLPRNLSNQAPEEST